MRPTIARRRVYDHLRTSMPGVLAALRDAWGADLLPEFVMAGDIVHDLIADAPPGQTLYISPQEVRSFDGRLPLVAVTLAQTTGLDPVEKADSLTEEFRGSHAMQIYCWIKAPLWEQAADMIEALSGAVAYCLLSNMALGSPDIGTRLVPTSVGISFSEIERTSDDGAIAGAAVSCVVAAEDHVTRIATGNVQTTQASVHPAME